MTAYEDSETRRANIAFIKRSMETPLLSREHEYALARAWREENNDRALHELINAYNRLVVSTAGRFKNYGLPVGDLIQEGVVGLLHAANRNRFGPPLCVTRASTCPWVDHSVSRLPPLTIRSIQTCFRFGCGPEVLNLASDE